MSKYKFQVYEKVDGDSSTEYKLLKLHDTSENIDTVTENQLEKKNRFGEEESTLESQLEKVRSGNEEKVTEKLLNDSKSKLVKHRNEDTYKGDINKLEEQRNENKKKEKKNERPELASSYSKSLKWWDVKSEDGLKVATASNCQSKIVEASRVLNTNRMTREAYASAAYRYAQDANPASYTGSINVVQDEIVSEPNQKPNLYMVLKYDPSILGDDTEFIKEVAFEKVLSLKSQLRGVLKINDFIVNTTSNEVVLDVFGDEFGDKLDFEVNDSTIKDLNEKSPDLNITKDFLEHSVPLNNKNNVASNLNFPIVIAQSNESNESKKN